MFYQSLIESSQWGQSTQLCEAAWTMSLDFSQVLSHTDPQVSISSSQNREITKLFPRVYSAF